MQKKPKWAEIKNKGINFYSKKASIFYEFSCYF